MRYYHKMALLMLSVAGIFLLTACGDDYSGDIDKLNSQYDNIERRVTSLEDQVKTLNTQMGQLSVLAYAVEQGFYITEVNSTTNGYEITLSNGRVIVLQKGTDKTLIPMPGISMTQISGFYYWTLNGMLLTGDDGKPIRSDGMTPIVRYDYINQQWIISIDGGATFKEINTYASVIINDKVLMQVINNYVRENSSTIISQEILFQVISTYIQQNYANLFDVRILNEVVATYINEHYTRIFSYELLEKIFTQYNFSYITNQINVEELVNAMLSFIREHQEVFMDSEVLYEIISSYFQMNKSTIFTNELLLEVVNNFIENHSNYVNVELLTQLVSYYIDQHQEEVFNIESVRNLIFEYVQRNYVQLFSQEIITRVINNYVSLNKSTIFNETLIKEILNTYVKNNYTSIFTNETVIDIINSYVTKNASTFINRDVLTEVITNYFQKNYNLFIDETVVKTAVSNYIETHSTTLIDTDIIWHVVNSYLEQYYSEVFSYDMLTTVVQNYFEQNTKVIGEYISQLSGIIRDVETKDDVCYVTLSNGSTLQLMVYDAYARLRDRVQSIVIMPEANGHVTESKQGYINLRYLVSPAAMANVIASKFYKGEMTLELKVTDANSYISTITSDKIDGSDGILSVYVFNYSPGSIKNIALHVKETKAGGTDIMTEFTPVDIEGQQPDPGNLTCPDNHHPHLIDLGLPSGTKWACCNVDASKPEDYGGYYAWGETSTKNVFSRDNYQHYKNNQMQNIGVSICGTNYDVAHVKWGGSWRMPSKEQIEELLEYCDYTWIGSYTTSTTNGGKFTSKKNGASIFIPAAGFYWEDKNYAYDQGRTSTIWSGTCFENNFRAYGLYFGDLYKPGLFTSADWWIRYCGHTVRPVQGEIDERITSVIPDDIRPDIDPYIPIYDGKNPPNIEGTYYLSPQMLIGSSISSDQIGKVYASERQKYSNQDMTKKTIDMVRVSDTGTEWSKGSGAYISGSGNNFTIYFDQIGETSGIPYKWAYIISGTKTATGIKNLTCGFFMKEKGYDPDHRIVEVGTFRFFKDQDGMSEITSWPYGNQYGIKKRNVKGYILPNILDK